MEHVVQPSNATYPSRILDVIANGPRLAQGQQPGRTLRGVRNDAWNATSAQIHDRSRRSEFTTGTTVSKVASRIACGLFCSIASFPLARANEGDDEGVNFIISSSDIQMAARSYGAAQLMRDNPVIGTVALIATTAMMFGSVFSLLRSSTSTHGTFSARQGNIGVTVMSACENLAAEIPSPQSVTFQSPLLPKMQAIERWADELVNMVNAEIADGTLGASLEQMRICIDTDLREHKLKPLRDQLSLMTTHLMMGGIGVNPNDIRTLRRLFTSLNRLASRINGKLMGAADQLATEINRQRERPIPRLG